MTIFKSFQSTVSPPQPRQWSQSVKLLVDAVTGAPTGIQNPNANGADGMWTPVDVTAGQIASPTTAMIADLNAEYRLNVAPYTRYRSDGTSLVTVPSSGGTTTYTAPQTFNAGINGFGVVSLGNSVTSGAAELPIGSYWSIFNGGPNSVIAHDWIYKSRGAGTGFDVQNQYIYNVTTPAVGTGTPYYYQTFGWVLTPSDTANSWGSANGEWNMSVRLPTTPGWHRDRTAGPQVAGGFLQLAIATSSVGATLVNPFTTTNGSATVAVAYPAHMLQTGQYVNFANASAVGGLTLSGKYAVTVVDANNFTVTAGGNATSGATGGGTVTATQFNGTDQLYAYAVSPSTDFNDATGRPAKTYIGFNVEPNALVGTGRDPNAHGGNGYYASGARVALAANPITTNGTTTVSLAWPNSGMANSDTFVIAGATAVSAFTAAGTFTAISVTSTTVTFSTGGATPAAATGGGSNVLVWCTKDIPRAGFEADGALGAGWRTDAATTTAAGIMAPAQTLGWADGTGTATITGTEISAGNVSITIAPAGTGVINNAGPVALKAYTVTTLPAASTALKGCMAYVTDATSPTYNGALTGSGAVVVPVFCNGTSWVSH